MSGKEIMFRYFIFLSYDGTAYHGWQRQPNGLSVQQILEEAMTTLLRSPVTVTGAGRTDAGVNAACMVAHFDSLRTVYGAWLVYKLNRLLPSDVAVQRVVPVKPEAHARFSAVSRTYRYYICTERNPFYRKYRYQVGGVLDMTAMNRAARLLFEYSDFTSFSKLHTDVRTNLCRITQAEWQSPDETNLVFVITADRFLRNMVRAIVGTLLQVGRGRLSVEEFRQVILCKQRGEAGDSVPGRALFLTDVAYPEDIFI